MLTREQIEKREEEVLAPYAMKSSQSRGRVHKESKHLYRSCYQRDRDRIIYSRAFRRLEYKTQVFVNHEGDHYRTRLTHTLEVAQIAKSIGRALRLNEDLIEAIALAHDVGHTPFGHAGEDALHEIMEKYGGFEHNSHGLRVVDILEKRYPEFPGLNLSHEVREGIIKHSSPFDHIRSVVPFELKGLPLLETQVVDIADEIAYNNHDLDDGITSGLISRDDLNNVGLWKEVQGEIKAKYPGLNEEIEQYQIIRSLINIQVSDLLTETERRIVSFKLKSPEEIRKIPEKIVGFSKTINEKRKPLGKLLTHNLYQHYRVIRMSNKARRFMHDLFKAYVDQPEQMPPSSQVRLKKEDKYRVTCDYIAGMTDRYALDEHKKLFEPYESV